ncbi:DUF1707 domain-containing protein [Stackebrandtia soli]|uniref:DUF1707 domain-containing protein n=1 Tax=Stackebrandtia soli TaxID=1892856 RepID=UPI0039E793D0
MSDDAHPPAPDRSGQRAADSDRKLTVDRLRHALDEGRLDLSEYDERIASAYQAKTYGDLDRLLADIPGTVPAGQSELEAVQPGAVTSREAVDKRRARRRKELRGIWSGFGGALIFFTGLWAIGWIASGNPPGHYWPAWIVGIWGIGALASTWSKLMNDD